MQRTEPPMCASHSHVDATHNVILYLQVLNVQEKTYSAAIIHNFQGNDTLDDMTSDPKCKSL